MTGSALMQKGEPMNDLISRQAASDELYKMLHDCFWADDEELDAVSITLNELPSVQPTLNGYDINHLILIAELLKKENLPPERVSDALYDISRVVDIAVEEFKETLRKSVEQCMI